MTDISRLPTLKRGDQGSDVKILQLRLQELGYFNGSIGGNFFDVTEKALKDFQRDYGLKADGVFGPVTKAKMASIDAPQPSKRKSPPWYLAMVGWTGKGEKDKSFVAYMSGFWGRVGLPGYKTIVGSRFAWCGLGVAAALIVSNVDYAKNGAGAKNWAKYGVAYPWKENGIPRGAIIHINPKSCTSGSGNHVTLANGDCSLADIQKPNATFGAIGANQQDQVKVSVYKVSSICAVRWPKDYPIPSKIVKSENCTGTGPTNESTR